MIPTTSTTTVVPTSTTSTTVVVGLQAPGSGLQSHITGATVSASGTVVVTFTLTDGDGNPVKPVTTATSDPTQAQVRFTIARLELDAETYNGFTTTFTRYENYKTPRPGYDSGGTLATLDPVAGTYAYTFATTLPAGFPAGLTHTVGGQVTRTFEGAMLVANPVFDFVPAGGPVTTVREDTTTAQCNGCHDPLEAHGGTRQEVHLCQLCHTEQLVDANGNSAELQNMIHRLHRGQDLPSIVNGPVGAQYAFGNTVFAEKVKACAGGPIAGVSCATDADCAGGTCTGSTVTGVGFPQDIRTCTACHTDGVTASNYLNKPSPSACTGCHDDVNPSTVATQAGPPGTNHATGDLIGPQPTAICTVCHKATGNEFSITIPGAHTVPERSTQLQGLEGEIVSATGTPGNPVTVTFKITNGDGAALPSLSGMNRVAFAMSGPSTDFGGSSTPYITPTAVGGGSSGTLTGPDANGVYTYVTSPANGLPADASGTWRVGLEARRAVTVGTGSPLGARMVNEALQNPVLDFSVDGSPVVPRRHVVDIGNCGSCHGTFSRGFSIHGNLRNQTDYCVVCHNPNATDFPSRKTVTGADPDDQTIDFKHFIHKLHTGASLENPPYLIYGFGGAVSDFSDILYPGDRRDCAKCHVTSPAATYLLRLPDGVLATRQTMISSGVETTVGSTPPIQDACLACHDAADAAGHAQLNTTADGVETCGVCHGEGAAFAVSALHAIGGTP